MNSRIVIIDLSPFLDLDKPQSTPQFSNPAGSSAEQCLRLQRATIASNLGAWRRELEPWTQGIGWRCHPASCFLLSPRCHPTRLVYLCAHLFVVPLAMLRFDCDLAQHLRPDLRHPEIWAFIDIEPVYVAGNPAVIWTPLYPRRLTRSSMCSCVPNGVNEEKQRRLDSARRYPNFSTCSLLVELIVALWDWHLFRTLCWVSSLVPRLWRAIEFESEGRPKREWVVFVMKGATHYTPLCAQGFPSRYMHRTLPQSVTNTWCIGLHFLSVWGRKLRSFDWFPP